MIRIIGLLLMVLSATGASAATARCNEVRFVTQEPLSAGLVRAQPGATGFLELDPREGVSVSNAGVAHQGPYGPAVVVVQGPIGLSFEVGLEALPTNQWNQRGLELVELLVRVGNEQHRLGLEEAKVSIQLPQQGNEEQIAQTRIVIGAVFRYSGFYVPQTAHYRLLLNCLPASEAES